MIPVCYNYRVSCPRGCFVGILIVQSLYSLTLKNPLGGSIEIPLFVSCMIDLRTSIRVLPCGQPVSGEVISSNGEARRVRYLQATHGHP